jgi:hypothetical protein
MSANGAQGGRWLPTPNEGAFTIALRAYGPAEAIPKHTWQPPTVKKVQ